MKEQLLQHYGHNIAIAKYGPRDSAVNIALECETCNEVLTDYDLSEEIIFEAYKEEL